MATPAFNTAIIRFGYDRAYAIPVSKVQALLTILGECAQVEYVYEGDASRYVLVERQSGLSAEMINYEPTLLVKKEVDED